MSVTEAKKKFEEAKRAVEVCHESIRQLQKKSDDLQDSLPGLSRAVEEAEKAKVSALDAFALNSNKTTEQALKGARQAHEDAQKKLSETHELIEATARALKKQESELPKLHTQKNSLRHQVWKSVFDEIQASIPHEVFDKVRMLIVCGSQMRMTQQFVLDSLFKNPCLKDFQAVRNELCKKYNIE